jgi:hypothetical protein
MVWVEYGCPGHGKGSWDGLGAMAKTKVTRDLTDSNVQTPSRRITSALETAQHLRATFCTPQWPKKHKKNMKINKVVVMYLDTGEIVLLPHLRMCQQSRESSRRTHFCFLALPGTMP